MALTIPNAPSSGTAAGDVTLTLPGTPAAGDRYVVFGFSVDQNGILSLSAAPTHTVHHDNTNINQSFIASWNWTTGDSSSITLTSSATEKWTFCAAYLLRPSSGYEVVYQSGGARRTTNSSATDYALLLGNAPVSGDAIIAGMVNDGKQTAFSAWEHGAGGVAMTEDVEAWPGSGAPGNWSSFGMASVITTGTDTRVEVDHDDTGVLWAFAAAGFTSTVLPVTYGQTSFRIRSDDSVGLNVDSAWAAAADTNASIDVDTIFRLRMRTEETGGGSPNTGGSRLWYRKNTGTWTAISLSTSNVEHAVSTRYSHGANATELLSGSGTYVNGNGYEGSNGILTHLRKLLEWEDEWCINIIGADVANNDTLEFQVRHTVDGAYGSYAQSPTITVIKGGSSPQTVILATATEADTAGAHVASTPQTVILATASEVDTAGVHDAFISQTVVTVTASEVDSAGVHSATAGNVTAVTGTASEVDTANAHVASVGNITVVTGTASEADTAGVHTASGGNATVVTNTASEADTAGAHTAALPSDAPTRAGTSYNNDASTATTYDVDIAGDATYAIAGDLAVIHIIGSSNSGVVTEPGGIPSGWTKLFSGSNNDYSRSAWWKILVAGDLSASPQWGFDAAGYHAHTLDIIDSGTFDATTPINVSAEDVVQSVSATSPSALTTVADCLLLIYFGCDISSSASTTIDAGTETVDQVLGADFLHVSAYEDDAPTATTYTRTITTTSASQDLHGIMVAVAPVAAGGQTVVLSTTSEVDTAGAHAAVGGNVTTITGTVSEADTAGAHSASGGNVTVVISTASEVDTAGTHVANPGDFTVALTTTTEADTAGAHSVLADSTAILSSATEVDTASVHSASTSQTVVLVSASEADTAATHVANPGNVTAITVTASEVDSAGVHVATGGNVTVVLVSASEVDTAGIHAATAGQIVVVATASEVDTAAVHATSAVVTLVTASATEADSAGVHSAVGGPVTKILGSATEADTAGVHSAFPDLVVVLATASEVDTASFHGITTTSDTAGNTLATVYPTSQIAAGLWTDEAGATANLHLVIDETGAGGTDYMRGLLNGATTVGRFGLTDMPAGFVSMDSLDIEIRHSRGSVEAGEAADGNDDTELFAQIMKADGVTALTDEMSIEISTAGYAVKTETVSFTTVVAANQTDWDGAELRLRTTFTRNAGNDGHYTWIDLARLINGLYTSAGGTTVITGTASEVDTAGIHAATATSPIAVLGTATETDTAGVHSASTSQTVVLATASETDSAGVHAAVGNIAVVTGTASEVDTANVHATAAGNVTAILVTASEVDTAGVNAASGGNVTVVTGTTSEVDTAGATPVTATIVLTLGTATETDTAAVHAASGGNVTAVLGTTTETDLAGAHSAVAGTIVVLGTASEVDTAAVHAVAIGGVVATTATASETDSAGVHVATSGAIAVLGTATETDSAGTHAANAGNVTVILATTSETDSAGVHVASGDFTAVLATASETDTAGVHATATGNVTVVLGGTSEADTAGIHSASASSSPQTVVLGSSGETDSAGVHVANAGNITVSLASASELDTANVHGIIVGGFAVTLSTATEVDSANSHTANLPAIDDILITFGMLI